MKKFVQILIVLFIVFGFVDIVYATGGQLRKDSIIECNGVLYGQHSDDNHWHVAKEEDGSFYADGESLGTENPCNNWVVGKKEVKFLTCVDGDTAKFDIDGERYTARFLAIDTPETVHPNKGEEPWGKEASNLTCSLLTNAKKVELELDADSDKFDKYDRILVFVWADGVLVQDELIKKGFAEVAYLYGDYRHTPLLQDHEAVAKANKVGMWSEELSLLEQKKMPKEEVAENQNVEIGLGSYLLIITLLHLIGIFTPLGNKTELKKVLKAKRGRTQKMVIYVLKIYPVLVSDPLIVLNQLRKMIRVSQK